ncbi:MAG: cbb3-type cytochrome c oxidase subunit II [Verrucomicrobia bacterium]|nr:cbb3-type cytochrome c oxidase subunit II [Verrucomicrobiota bacterium]
MNYGPILFLGIFLSFALSWAGMVFLPQKQLGHQELAKPFDAEALYPTPHSGLAEQGRQVYRAEGCAACHTQQVRPQDVPQYGLRFTVAQDYLRDEPVQFGSLRLGPDLANIGARMPDAKWHLLHLYNPRITIEKSLMPQYKYLFEKRKIRGERSANALDLPKGFEVEEGFEVVPTDRADSLVAYMKSLRSDASLFESPLPTVPETDDTNAAPASAEAATPTNTNSPEK